MQQWKMPFLYGHKVQDQEKNLPKLANLDVCMGQKVLQNTKTGIKINKSTVRGFKKAYVDKRKGKRQRGNVIYQP